MTSNRKLIVIVIAVIALISAILYGFLYRNNSTDQKLIENFHLEINTLRDTLHQEIERQDDIIVMIEEDISKEDLLYLEKQLPITEVSMNEAMFLYDLVNVGNKLGEIKLSCFFNPTIVKNQSCSFNSTTYKWSYSKNNGIETFDLYEKTNGVDHIMQYHLAVSEETFTFYERRILSQNQLTYTETNIYIYEEDSRFTYYELENDTVREVYHKANNDEFYHFDNSLDDIDEILFELYDDEENMTFKIQGYLDNDEYNEFVYRQKNDLGITLFTIRFEDDSYESIKYNVLYADGWSEIQIDGNSDCDVYNTIGEKAFELDDCRINNYYMKERIALNTDILTNELLDWENDGIMVDVDFDRHQTLESEFLMNYQTYIVEILDLHQPIANDVVQDINQTVIDELNP